MSVLPELENRLSDSERRIAALIQHFEDHAELEQALRDAGSGLKDTNIEVKRLAESTKSGIESLAEVLASFRDAVEILRQADFAHAIEAVENMEKRLNIAEQETKETIGKVADAVSSGQKKTERQIKAEATAIRKTIPTMVTFLTLVLVLVLVGFEILRQYPTLLSG